jgi:spore coat protein U-like protein
MHRSLSGWLRRGAAAAIVCAGWLAPSRAEAACTITVTPVNFGAYDVFLATPDDATGTITYQCGPLDFNIFITLSRGNSATFARYMLNGTERLNYNLYRNAGRTNIWGDGTSGTSRYTRANPPNNQNVTLTVYGRIVAAQDVSAGAYTDTIVATINF